jgi:hypothetical protein
LNSVEPKQAAVPGVKTLYLSLSFKEGEKQMNSTKQTAGIDVDKQKFRAAGLARPEEETQSIQNPSANMYARLSLISITLTAIITTAHHVFRDGLGLLVPGGIIILLPYVLMRWFTQANNKWPIWIYGLYNVLIVVQLGVIDGFLDHVLKALGLSHLTFLPGGDAEVVQTVFSLWSPRAGNIFYEGTGILTFVGSAFATLYLYQFIRGLGQHGTATGATGPLSGPGAAGV